MFGIKQVIYKRNNMSFIINDSTLEYDGELFPIDNKLLINYLSSLFSITEDWEEEYIDTTFIDGDSWNLVIIYNNGNSKEYKGTSSFPNNFNSLENLNYKLLSEVQHV